MVILVCAVVDPILGEFRRSAEWASWGPGVGAAAGLVLGASVLYGGTDLTLPAQLGLAALAAGVAVAVERPQIPWIDDDLVMTLVPAVVLWAVARLDPAWFGAVTRPFT